MRARPAPKAGSAADLWFDGLKPCNIDTMAKGRFKIARCGIDGMDAVSADTSYAFGRHTHDQFGIGVILRGAQKSMSGRGIVEAQAGDVITVNPGEVHDGTPLGATGRAWRMLYFDPKILAGPVLDLTGGDTDSAELAYPTLRDATTSLYFLSLFRTMTNPHGGHSEIEGRENLLLLLARLIERRKRDQAGAPKAIERARAHRR